MSQCGVSVRAAVAVFLISEEALKIENIQLLNFSHTVWRIFSKHFFYLFIFMTLTSPIGLIDCFERSEEWLWWRSQLLIYFLGWGLPSDRTYISTLSTLMPQAVVASSRIPFNSIIWLRLFFRFVFCFWNLFELQMCWGSPALQWRYSLCRWEFHADSWFPKCFSVRFEQEVWNKRRMFNVNFC